MAKSKRLGMTDPIDIRKLANVERKARDSLPDFCSSFPQEVQFEVELKQGELPKPEIAMGFTLLSYYAMCEFDAQRFTQADMADMLMKLHRVGDLRRLGLDPGRDSDQVSVQLHLQRP